MATFQDAISEVTTGCDGADRLARIKVLLDATEEALYGKLLDGGVKEYRLDTGQSIVNVEVTSMAVLKKQYFDLLALYNQLCQRYNGTNVMVCRDVTALRR